MNQLTTTCGFEAMAPTHDFNVFVGAQTGLLKGINVNQYQVIAKNLNSIQSLDREQEITCLEWGNEDETEVLVGLKCQKVRIYDTEFQGFSGCVETLHGTGPLRGVGKLNGSLITAAENGCVKLWKFKKSEQIEINALNAGENLCKMRVSSYKNYTIATGGKRNDLQIWDLEKPAEPSFKAKNVKNDFLDLQIPVWISDLAFVPDSEQVVTCSRYGHVRVYDPKSRGRRPVASCVPEQDQAWSSLAITSRPNQVIVGSGKGRMVLFDLRQQKVVHSYTGSLGAIKEISSHKTKPLVVSVGYDRCIRVHHLDRKSPLHKTYLKSKLNAVLMRRNFDVEFQQEDEEEMVQENGESYVEADPLWKDMEVIKEKRSKHSIEEAVEEENAEESRKPKRKGSTRKMRKVGVKNL